MAAKSNAFTSSVWLRPPRGRSDQQPALSREQIVRTAIEILDAEGAAGLSMRRLGTRLGAGATSLYWYVAHKDELLELAVDEVIGEVYVPDLGDTGWRIGASVYASGMRTMLLRHPWVLGLLGTRPTMGPNAMRMGDRFVALLVGAGFQGVEVSHVSSMLMAHSIGSATALAAFNNTAKQSDQPVSEMLETLRPHIERIADEHPNYGKWFRETNMQIDPDQIHEEGFQFGLERLLDGLDLWLKNRPPPTP